MSKLIEIWINCGYWYVCYSDDFNDTPHGFLPLKNGKISLPDPVQPVGVRKKNSLQICNILDNSLLCENIALLYKNCSLCSKPAQMPIFFSLQIGLHFASWIWTNRIFAIDLLQQRYLRVKNGHPPGPPWWVLTFNYLYCFIKARLGLKNYKSNITCKSL